MRLNDTLFCCSESGGGLFGGGGLSGLGGKPSAENANKNVFGGSATFGESSANSGKYSRNPL